MWRRANAEYALTYPVSQTSSRPHAPLLVYLGLGGWPATPLVMVGLWIGLTAWAGMRDPPGGYGDPKEALYPPVQRVLKARVISGVSTAFFFERAGYAGWLPTEMPSISCVVFSGT
jgi:hypothetical protein